MPGKTAVQMYTVREFTKTRDDFARSLERVRAMGYPAVQLSAVGCMNGEQPEVDAPTARKMLDAQGLKCIATHRSWDALVDHTAAEIDFHLALGCDFAAIGGLPPRLREQGLAGFRAFVAEAAPIIARFKAAGIRFGYHNHAWEFRRVPEGGTWYDVFVNDGGADLMLEIDTYWAVHAGVDPVTVFARAPGRFPVIHFKDKNVQDNEAIMAPIGEGNLDWARIIPAAEAAGTEWYAVEQDNCYGRDPFDCLASSYRFLTAQGL